MEPYIVTTGKWIFYYKDSTEQMLHRLDGPAMVSLDGKSEWWYCNGRRHRLNGPAIKNEHVVWWFINDKPHKMDGPAVVRKDGSKEWYICGTQVTEAEFNELTKINN